MDASLLTDKWEEIIEDPADRDRHRGDGRYRAGQNDDPEALNAGKNVVTANKDLVAEHEEPL